MKLLAWLMTPAFALALAVMPALACDTCGCRGGTVKKDAKGTANGDSVKADDKAGDKNTTEEVAPDVATVDKKAPDFTLKNADGKEVTLSSYKGKIVVLEWANFDCPFVKKFYANSGHMPELQKKYRGEDVVWLMIQSNAEGKQGNFQGEALTKRLKEEKVDSAFYLLDDDSAVGRKYDAKTSPHMFVIDKESKLRYSGAIDSIKSSKVEDIEKATNYVEAAIKALKDGKELTTKETKPYGCNTKFAEEKKVVKEEKKGKN